MALNIPSPTEAGNGFLQGINTGSNLFSQFLQNKLARNRDVRDQQMLPHDIALKQAQVENYARLQKMMPYIIQQYEDQHGKAAADLFKQKLFDSKLYSALNEGGMDQQPQVAQQQLTQQPGMPPLNAPMNASNMTRKQLVSRANQDQAAYDARNGTGSNPSMMGSAPNISDVPQGTMPQQGMTASSGAQEVVVKPPRQGLEFLDKIAGLPGSPAGGIKTTTLPNGNLQLEYPSGKVAIKEIAPELSGRETPEQKRKAQMEKEVASHKGKLDATRANAIQIKSQELLQAAQLGKQLYDILEKNKDATSPTKGVQSFLKLPVGSDSSEFIETAGQLQAMMSKFAVSRPGIGSLKWAKEVKPSVGKSYKDNMGMVKGLFKQLNSELKNGAQEYKKLTGEDIGIELPQIGGIEQKTQQAQKLDKSHVNEENIQYTMSQTGLTREQVIDELRKRGLV